MSSQGSSSPGTPSTVYTRSLLSKASTNTSLASSSAPQANNDNQPWNQGMTNRSTQVSVLSRYRDKSKDKEWQLLGASTPSFLALLHTGREPTEGFNPHPLREDAYRRLDMRIPHDTRAITSYVLDEVVFKGGERKGPSEFEDDDEDTVPVSRLYLYAGMMAYHDPDVDCDPDCAGLPAPPNQAQGRMSSDTIDGSCWSPGLAQSWAGTAFVNAVPRDIEQAFDQLTQRDTRLYWPEVNTDTSMTPDDQVESSAITLNVLSSKNEINSPIAVVSESAPLTRYHHPSCPRQVCPGEASEESARQFSLAPAPGETRCIPETWYTMINPPQAPTWWLNAKQYKHSGLHAAMECEGTTDALQNDWMKIGLEREAAEDSVPWVKPRATWEVVAEGEAAAAGGGGAGSRR